MTQNLLTTLIVGITLTGCATVPMGDTKRDLTLKLFPTVPDRACIYIYRNETVGTAIRMTIDLDGQRLGETAIKTFLYKEVVPGKHTIVSHASNDDSITFDTVAGKSYYVWQKIKLAYPYAGANLQLVEEVEGKLGVLQTRLALSQP